MEYLAKIAGEKKDGNFWKYDFVDPKTGKENSFYHCQKLNCILILVGKLKLFWDGKQQSNFLQSFKQVIANHVEGSRFEELSTQDTRKSRFNLLL